MLSIQVGETRVGALPLGPVDVRVPPGHILVVTGPNGCGKTTLLDMVGGFVPNPGRMCWASTDFSKWPAWRRHAELLGRSFQRPPGLPALGLFERVAFPSRGNDANDAISSGTALSYGQKKTAWVSAVLQRRMPVFLLDEPWEGLDPWNANAVTDLLSAGINNGSAAVIVTHDLTCVPQDIPHAILRGECTRLGTRWRLE